MTVYEQLPGWRNLTMNALNICRGPLPATTAIIRTEAQTGDRPLGEKVETPKIQEHYQTSQPATIRKSSSTLAFRPLRKTVHTLSVTRGRWIMSTNKAG